MCIDSVCALFRFDVISSACGLIVCALFRFDVISSACALMVCATYLDSMLSELFEDLPTVMHAVISPGARGVL